MILAVDIGSNTIKCLLGYAENGSVVRVYEESLDRRIMGRDGGLVKDAARIISDSIIYFEKAAAKIFPDFSVKVVATSALRDCRFKGEILSEVFLRTSREIKILSGEEEAELSFSGAMADGAVDKSKPCVYFDLGGGSMEVVAGKSGKVEMSKSLDIGAVRLTRECSASDEYFARAKAAFDANLAEFPPCETLVGAGGAVVAARFMKQKLGLGGPENVVTLGQIKKCFDVVLLLTFEERIKKFSISANRADIIPAAFACIIELMNHLKMKELIHTFCNIRYGIILSQKED